MMAEEQARPRPTLHVIAGPNGSGKSTFTLDAQAVLRIQVIDPDQEARAIRPDAPQEAAVEAGRRVINRSRAYLKAGTSFAIETTLAGAMQLRLMEEAKKHGYEVNLIYIGVESADLCIERVALRFAKGGHDVPAADVRRRYQRSMSHLPAALRLADHAIIFDNSTEQGHRKLLAVEHGHIVAREPNLPQWIIRCLGTFLTPPTGE
jgi:predicted ABC-type ATPase